MFAHFIQIAPSSHDKILLKIIPLNEVTKDANTSQILQCIEGKVGLGSSFGLVVYSRSLKVNHVNVIFNLNGVLIATKF
jgi:hypothetical protein